MEVVCKGVTVLIDEEDLGLFQCRTWAISTSTGYIVYRNSDRKMMLLFHREVLGLQKGVGIVDHINGNPLDNRKSNLRLCTPSQNGQNKRISPLNRSGLKCAIWDEHAGKWKSNIRVNGTRKHLGMFSSPELAHEAYRKAAKEYFGEFARLS